MSAAEQNDRTLSIDEAAAFLRDELGMKHVTARIVGRLANEHKLPFFKVGRSRVIFEQKLVEYMRRQQIEAERAVSRGVSARKRK